MASQAGAQTASGGAGWGAEGHIASGSEVFLSRWFSDEWTLLFGGTAAVSSSKRNESSDKNEYKNLSLTALLRRSWGSGSVRPFIGVGPSFTINQSKNTSNFSGAVNTSKDTGKSIGARGEFGALVPVASKVYLGLSTIVAYGHSSNESTNLTGKSKSSGNGVSAGNLQFLIGFRF
ncbi:MAG: hypothetical protein ABI852_12520 [Gemmatimonadaceae bacterium]